MGGPNPAAYTNIVGAAISVAVLIGIVGWGAKTLVRDSSGVPVVMALEGPMRIVPDDPGGVPASHQGLTVNEVAGNQAAATVSADLQLAPRPITLQDGDQPSAVVTPVLRPNVEVEAEQSISSSPQTVEELAAMLAASSAPQSDLAPTPSQAAVQVAVTGVQSSLRPQLRPTGISDAGIAVAAQPTVTVSAVIAPGTRMAQLGAYESMPIAEAEWARLSARFANYFADKKHVIQTASSGGSTFYRLRVHGFDDAGDARRLCSALISQNAACYPVTMN